MRLLLDAHVLIWLYLEPGKLPQPVERAVRDPANAKYVGAATLWELEIKRAAGRLRAPSDLRLHVLRSGFLELPVGFDHAELAASLPLHHGDPFDRMLVAQAQVEELTIVSADPQIARYEVEVLAA